MNNLNERIRETGKNIKEMELYIGTVLFDEPLSAHTTMKVGGKAPVFCIPQNESSLILALEQAVNNNIRYFILGGGSNLIFSDSGFEGIIISTEGLNYIKTECKSNISLISCGCGTQMNDICKSAAKNALSGLEQFSGLPGSCGGSVFMNARCYDKSISDVLFSVNYYDLTAGKKETYNFNAQDWDYKKSPFMDGNKIILDVCFKVDKLEETSQNIRQIEEKNAYYINEREIRGHFKAPSAGSVFKNNRSFGKPSGALIDQQGLKGTVCGGAQIAPWHGNFIINNGTASAKDIKNLVNLAIQKVKDATGFTMECEIIFVD